MPSLSTFLNTFRSSPALLGSKQSMPARHKLTASQYAGSENDNTFYPVNNLSQMCRDRYDYDRQTIFSECLRAWRANPFARRIVKLISMFIVGKGIEIKSDNKHTEKYLQSWSNHPLNQLDRKVINFCYEATRSGNLFFLCTADSYTGMLYVRAFPADQVDKIVTSETDVDQELAFKPRDPGLPISMEGVYRWVVFLPLRVNECVPVANRYFGVFQDGSVKVRGIEARRRDSAPFIVAIQLGLLEILARASDADGLPELLSQAQAYARRQLERLRKGQVAVEQLLVSQKLSQNLGAYSSPSPAARAVWQMQAAGKLVRPGQRVRFLYMLVKPGVSAWDVPEQPDVRSIDLVRYRALLQRAIQTVLASIEQAIPGSEPEPRLYFFPALAATDVSA